MSILYEVLETIQTNIQASSMPLHFCLSHLQDFSYNVCIESSTIILLKYIETL